MTLRDRLGAGGPGTDDRERTVGLIAAPVAALIATLVTTALANHRDRAAGELFLVLMALATVMVVSALMRRRLPLGAAAALYGLALFNLHFWGFALPFVLVGAWMLVRAYRTRPVLAPAPAVAPAPVRANKRFTPRAR